MKAFQSNINGSPLNAFGLKASSLGASLAKGEFTAQEGRVKRPEGSLSLNAWPPK
jgi:hypothetical protein